MCTRSEPPQVPGEAKLERLDDASRPEIESLLARGNPLTDARPFQLEGQHWVGARDQHGALVPCGVEEANVAGFPILSGITVRPDHRGQRLGLAVTAYLTREAVQRRGVCTLSMYSDNDVARRVYTGLGYGRTRRWQSRRLRSAVPGLGEQAE